MLLAVVLADGADHLAFHTDDFVGGVIQLYNFVADGLFLLFGGVRSDNDDHVVNLRFL